MFPVYPISNLSFGVPVGAIIAFAGYIGPPVSLPASPFDYSSSPPLSPAVTNNIEGWGWMVCDGRLVYCRDYPLLFMAIGFLYSRQGDTYQAATSPLGLTNSDKDAQFRVPDYRGYFLRGATGTSKNDPDAAMRTLTNTAIQSPGVGSLQMDALQNHEHNYKEPAATATGGDGEPVLSPQPLSTLASSDPNPTNLDKLPVNTSNAENRPKNMAVHYLIKYSNVFG